ncbi:hypothetical protein L1049_021979 [Liquidambar formosana]|uniref:Pentatricopeptide repeat-containing protein n=1 Tax=Liquidambar formosana TaxID=63359 RepID=A0AAP0RBU5_LIQFO
MRGLCRIKNVEEAKKLLFKMIDAGPLPGNAVFNSLINALSKAGDMEEAKEMMKLMESRGLKPDVYTYSVIMSGYVKGGQMEDACKVLSEAKKKHTKLTPVTYHILIRGYCKLEEFDKALKLFSEMKDFGVQPNTDEYNKLIQSLCLKALNWGMAEKLLEEMKENGLHLNGITRGLIRAVKEMEEEGVETREIEEVRLQLNVDVTVASDSPPASAPIESFTDMHFYHVLTSMTRPQGRGLELARKHIASYLSELDCIRRSSDFLRSSACNTSEHGIDDRTTASGCQPIGFDATLNSRLSAPTPRAIRTLSWEKVLLVQDGKLYGRDPIFSVISRAAALPEVTKNHDIQKNE